MQKFKHCNIILIKLLCIANQKSMHKIAKRKIYIYIISQAVIIEKNNIINEVISKVRQNLAEKRLLMSWKW